MDKLNLNLDDLAVDSFHAEDAETADPGTVRGQGDPIDLNTYQFNCPILSDGGTCLNCSLVETCGGFTCDASCNLTCGSTCDFSCNGTCDLIGCGRTVDLRCIQEA